MRKESAEQSAALFLRERFGLDFTNFTDQRVVFRNKRLLLVRSRFTCASNALQVIQGVGVPQAFLIEAVGEYHARFIALIGQGKEFL